MKQFVTIVLTFLPLLASSYYVKIGILSHDLDIETTKKIWSMAQNYSTMMSLEPIVEITQWRDIDSAAKFSRSICSLAENGIDALVYLGSPRWNSFISPFTTFLGLPFITAEVNPAYFGPNQVCMLPDTTEAATDIIIRYGWNRFIFFYDSNIGPDQLQKILSSLLSAELTPRVEGFLKVDSVSHALYFLKYLPSLMRRQLLLATSEQFADELANACDKCDILLLNPVGTVKMTSHRRDNMLIKLSVVSEEDPVLVALENRLKTLSSFKGQGRPGKEIPDSAILHYDSSSTLDATFNRIVREKPSALKSRQNTGCFNTTPGEITEIFDSLEKIYIEHGATGTIAFDEKGRRYDYKLNIMQSTPFGDIEKVGTWSDRTGLQMFRETAGPSSSPTYAAYKNEFSVKVTSVLAKPFLQGENETRRGFVVDLLAELSKETKMDFKLRLVQDGFYGKLVDGEWTGMIGELVRGEADIAIAPLSKTLERQKVIDFGKNFISTGLNILIKKTESGVESSTFSSFTFLSIWSVGTWIVLIFAVAVYSAGSYGISRFIGSPDRVRALESKGTDNLSPCGSVWFTIGSLLCRDTGIYPRYITHRLWALLWWIFCIFIGLLYVSMLTSELIKVRTTVITTHSRKTSHEVLKDYVETGLPVLGAVTGGSTAQLFMKSEIGLYQQVGRLLMQNPDSMAASYDEGTQRVRKSDGKYAFIMESASSEFIANEEPCDTLVTPGYLFTRPHAVAFPKNSSLKDTIDHAILTLEETGRLRQLYEKWWHTETSTCEDPALNILPKVYDTSMTLHEVSGVFYLFILFSLLSVAAAAGEYYIRTRNIIVK